MKSERYKSYQREYQRRWRKENPEKWASINRNSRIRNITRARLTSKKRSFERRKTDIQFRLRGNLRARLNEGMKKEFKKGSSVGNLGCSISAFKSYIENLWVVGMTWENYGVNGWHLDHISPLSSFDLNDSRQFHTACHYTNYQPLWATDNRKKAAKSIF